VATPDGLVYGTLTGRRFVEKHAIDADRFVQPILTNPASQDKLRKSSACGAQSLNRVRKIRLLADGIPQRLKPTLILRPLRHR